MARAHKRVSTLRGCIFEISLTGSQIDPMIWKMYRVDEAGKLHCCPGNKIVRVFLKLMKIHSRASFFQQVELKLIISTIIEFHANTLDMILDSRVL